MSRVLLNALQAGNRSGTGRYATELARRLPALDGDVEVFVLWPRHIPIPDCPEAARERFVTVESLSSLARIGQDQFGIRSVRKRLGAQVVHYPANIGPLAPMAGTVLTVHDLTFLRFPEWYRWDRSAYYRASVPSSVRQAERIIADSESTAADLREFLHVRPERIDVIPLAVAAEFRPASQLQMTAAIERYHLPAAFFLYEGTLEPRKNLVRLIQAWSEVAADCRYDLVIAGRAGWKCEPVEQAAAASPFAQRIHFPGFIEQEDLPAVLSAARVFVWPSLYEGFGLPPLEAMACGTPVITSNTSSLPEVVGDAALAVDPENVAALARAMKAAADDDSLRIRLSAAGALRAAEFSWDYTSRLTLASYCAAGA